MGSRLDLGRSTLRRCKRHKLVLQRDGKCALCREPERRGSGRSVALGLLAATFASLGAFAFDDLFSQPARSEHAAELPAVTTGAREQARAGRSASAAETPGSGANPARRVHELTPAEDQFLRSAPAADEQTGDSPPPPRAFVETEPSAPDSQQDFALPRQPVQHAQR
jgi:hypothetical protein